MPKLRNHRQIALAVMLLVSVFCLGCTRPELVPQSRSGVYFSVQGEAISIHPGGAVSFVSSSSGPYPLPPGPHRTISTASLSPAGSVVLELTRELPSVLAGAVVTLPPDGSNATVDWTSTKYPGRGREVFSR